MNDLIHVFILFYTKYQEQNKCIFSTCSFSFILE